MRIACNGYWMETTGDEVLVGSGAGDDVLLHLRGEAAKRAHELVRLNGAGAIADWYNCHAAAEFVMFGRNADRIRAVDADPAISTAQTGVRGALETLELPCGFRLHSACEDDPDAFVISHSAVLLGEAAGEVLVFEKDGRGPLRICTMETVRVDQRRTNMELAYFYGTPKTPAGPQVS